MSFGLTAQGLIIKRLADILAEMNAAWQGAFGIGVNLDPSSPAGQIIGIQAEREALIQMLLQDVYNSFYPDTAQGVSLDNVCALSGITRLPATFSTVVARVTGVDTTAVIKGAFIASVLGNPLARFVNDEAFVISAPGLNEVQVVSFTGAPDAGTFKLTFMGQQTVAINWNDVAATLQTALRNLGTIGAGNVTVTGDFVAGFTITFVSGLAHAKQELVVVSQNSLTAGGNALGIGVTETVQGTGPYADVPFIAETAGPFLANVGSLTVIETPTSGITGVTNLDPATSGFEVETDAELRIRRSNNLQVSGSATVEGIRAALAGGKVAGVTSAVVIENVADVADGSGRPPHSFEAVVAGGSDADVAEAIWKSKPAGIQTFGNVTVVVVDSQGFNQTIKFSRPTLVPIYIIVNITKNTDPNEGAVYPANGNAEVASAIINYGLTFKDGQDVVVNLFYTPINQVPGVIGIEFLVGLDPVPTLSNNLPIAITALATFDLARITVNS